MTTVFKHKNDIILIHMKTTETTERCFLATYVFNSLDKQWLGKHNTICESFKIRSDSNLMKQKRGAGGNESFKNIIPVAFVFFANLNFYYNRYINL